MIDPGIMKHAPLLDGLSGLVVVKNSIELDYCIEECVRSLLRVCDEVVVGDGGSTDGTLELLLGLQKSDRRLRVVTTSDYTTARGDAQWFVNWINEGRRHCRFTWCVQLDADEVLDDRPHILEAVRNAATSKHTLRVDRLNFVRDPQHLIPDGECCGKYVMRIGPSDMFWPSDEPRSWEEAPILALAQRHDDIKLFHLGFLRPQDNFYAKAKIVLGAFFNEYDKRMADAEAAGKPFHESGLEWMDRLVPYDGYIPKDVAAWMRARGFTVP